MKFWLKLKHHFKICSNEISNFLIFSIIIGAHSQMEAFAWSWPNPLQEEWYSFNYKSTCTWRCSLHEAHGYHAPMILARDSKTLKFHWNYRAKKGIVAEYWCITKWNNLHFISKKHHDRVYVIPHSCSEAGHAIEKLWDLPRNAADRNPSNGRCILCPLISPTQPTKLRWWLWNTIFTGLRD